MGTPAYKTVSMLDRLLDEENETKKIREDIRSKIHDIISNIKEIEVQEGKPYESLAERVNLLTLVMKRDTEYVEQNDNWFSTLSIYFNGVNKPDADSLLLARAERDPAFARAAGISFGMADVETMISIQAEIDRIMTETAGKAMMEPNFREVVKVMNQFEEAKSYHELQKVIDDTGWHLYYFDKLENNLADFEKKVGEFVAKTKTGENANLDFTQVDNMVDQETMRVNALSDRIEEKTRELNIFEHRNPKAVALVKANEIANVNLRNIIEKRIDLDNKSTTGIENSNLILGLAKDISAHQEKIDSLTISFEKNKEVLNTLTGQEPEIKERLQEIDRFEKNTMSSMKIKAADMDNAIKTMDSIQVYENILKCLNDKDAISCVSSLLKDCDKLEGEELRNKIDQNQSKLSLNVPLASRNSAREIVNYLIFDRKLTPEVAKDATNPIMLPTIIANFNQDLKNAQDELANLAKKVPKSTPETFIKAIETIKNNRKIAENLNESLAAINEYRSTNEKLTADHTKELNELYSEDSLSDFKNKIDRIITQLRSMGANEKDLKPVENFIKYAANNKEAYKQIAASVQRLMDIHTKTLKTIDAAKKECDVNEKANLKTISENKIALDELKKGRRDELVKLSEDLAKADLERTKAVHLSSQVKNLFAQQDNILYDMEKANGIADKLASRIDEEVTKSILKDMTRIYRTLNDARIKPRNSQFYENMIAPLCATLKKEIPTKDQNLKTENVDISGLKPSFEQLKSTMGFINNAAKEYLNQRDNLKWYSSKQAYQRVHLAKQLISMCENVNKKIEFGENYKQEKVIKRIDNFKKKTELVKELNKKVEGKEQIFESKEDFKPSRYIMFKKILNKIAEKKNKAENEPVNPTKKKYVFNPSNALG